MRLIDADKLEPSEVYMNYGFTRIVYMDDIDEMPTVDPVKHGKWVEQRSDASEPHADRFWKYNRKEYRCSECGKFCSDSVWNYCPRCGAMMEEEDETD